MNGVIIYLRTKTVCNAGLFACQGPKPGSHPRFACPSIDQAASAATVHGLLNSSHLTQFMCPFPFLTPTSLASDKFVTAHHFGNLIFFLFQIIIGLIVMTSSLTIILSNNLCKISLQHLLWFALLIKILQE